MSSTAYNNRNPEVNWLLLIYFLALFIFLLSILPACRTVNKSTSSVDSTSVNKVQTVTVVKRDTLTVDNNTIEYVFQTDTIHKNDTVWLFKDRIVSNRPLKSIKQSVNRLQSGSRIDLNSIASSDSARLVANSGNKIVKSTPAWVGLAYIALFFLGIMFIIAWFGGDIVMPDPLAKIINKVSNFLTLK